MQIVHRKSTLCSIAFVCVLLLALGLYYVFSGSVVLPQLFSLGPLNVRYYGLTMALAVGAGWWLALRRAPQFGVTTAQADSLLQWLVLGGFMGARLYHVASSWQYYWQFPLDIFKVWQGGLSIFGALLGGFVVIVLLTFKQRHHLVPRVQSYNLQLTTYNYLDWLIPSVVLGQIIGRFGNLFNYEAFGYPTKLPWKMFVPEQYRPPEFLQDSFFHPLFLYEALGNVLVLCVLLRVFRGRRQYAGSLFFLYLFLYNALRFVIEFWRVDSTFLWGIIRLNTLSSAVLCVVGMAGLVLGSMAVGKLTFFSKSKAN